MASARARQPVAGAGGPAVVCPWCAAAMIHPGDDVARLAPGRLLCAGGCAVECDARGRRWWADGARVPNGAAFPTPPAADAPAARPVACMPLPDDWRR